MKYDWKITALRKAPAFDGLSNVITGISFLYTGTDENGITGSFNGACPVLPPSSDSFTPIADLTEEVIIEWAKANHGVHNMQEVISDEIKSKITPMYDDVTELDWLNKEKPEAEAVEPETEPETDTPVE